MKMVPFASTGVEVSRMCLGTMMFGDRCDEPEAERIVAAALDRGVNFIDTASMYCEGRTEEIVGRILRDRRDRVFLATKVNARSGAEYPALIGSSLEASLKRLGTDRVDLYLIHWPRKGMDPAAMLKALGETVRSGKARFIGCCNFPAWLLAHFNALATVMGVPKLINNQIPYNLIERGVEVEVLPQARAGNIAITCYRPLMAGVLAGKYHPARPLPSDARVESDERLAKWMADHAAGLLKLFAVAQNRGVPPAHVAIAWLNDQPGVTCPIVGVSRLAQFAESADAFDLALSAAEKDELADAFASAVKEYSQYYGPLRRSFELMAT